MSWYILRRSLRLRCSRRPDRTARCRRLHLESLERRWLLANLPAGFEEAAIATGLSNATAMEIAPGGDLWVLEQGGAVKRYRPGSTTADVVGRIATLGLSSAGERGLLGIAFDPQYATNKQVFLYYTSTSGGVHNRISRFTVEDADAADYFFAGTSESASDKGSDGTPTPTVIFDLDPLSATNHNGGAIHFGPDGKLYVAVGENAVPSNAQSLSTVLGKMLRMNADGTAPSDNPFFASTTGKNQTIWALGLRNPYTFGFQPASGRMFINDVGQNTWEEINEGIAGANYGWPATEGDTGNPPNSPGTYRGPLYTYQHGSGAFNGFAITGGVFYNPSSANFPASYMGDYFFADYVSDWINVLDLGSGTASSFATAAGSPVDLRVAGDGTLYYLSRDQGRVMQVRYTAENHPPTLAKLTDQQVAENGTISVPLTIGDVDTGPGSLAIAVTSDQPELIPASGLVVQGNGSNRTLQITPAAGQRGDAILRVSVSDGSLVAQRAFFLTVSTTPVPWHNPRSAFDVNADGSIAPDDALEIINQINAFGSRPLAAPTTLSAPPPYFDVKPDNFLAPIDALYVINVLNAPLEPAEGESGAAAADLVHDNSASIDAALWMLLATDVSAANRPVGNAAAKRFAATRDAITISGWRATMGTCHA